MKRADRFGLILLFGFLAGTTSVNAQQPNRSVRDGVYTGAQADRGKGQYVQHCAVCHGTALEGNGEAPPLIGEFIPDWTGTTLSDLFDKIEVTMPLNAPGTLRPQIAADILAYMLQENGFPAGSKELAPASESLSSISFELLNPKAPAISPKKAADK